MVKTKVKKEKRNFQWCGVRFIHGENLGTVYSYKVRKGVKLHLGQELVVRNHRGTSIVVVVAVNEEPNLPYSINQDYQRKPEDMNWKWISEKVSKL